MILRTKSPGKAGRVTRSGTLSRDSLRSARHVLYFQVPPSQCDVMLSSQVIAVLLRRRANPRWLAASGGLLPGPAVTLGFDRGVPGHRVPPRLATLGRWAAATSRCRRRIRSRRSHPTSCEPSLADHIRSRCLNSSRHSVSRRPNPTSSKTSWSCLQSSADRERNDIRVRMTIFRQPIESPCALVGLLN
jgi:hypothetical protein